MLKYAWFYALVNLPLSFTWFISPLGFGFSRPWPVGIYALQCARIAYSLSYFMGIPALILLPIGTAILVSCKVPSQMAFWLFSAAIIAWLIPAMTYLALTA